MSNFITLEDLGAKSAQYQIKQCTSSTVSYMPHYHDYYQIGFVTSGEFCHSQGSNSVILYAGDAFILPPGFIHRLHFGGENPELYSLAFQETVFHQEFVQSRALRFLKELQSRHDTYSVQLCLTLSEEQRSSLLSLCQCLLRQQQQDIPAELSAAPSLISAIVNILTQDYYHNSHNNWYPWNNSDNAQLLRRCIAYINTHCTETINADELAKRFGLSRSVLCSAFKQQTGLPIHKYISQKRIEKAQILMRTCPEMMLSQIAWKVGYEDDSTFYRNFLKIAGMTPSAYRGLCDSQETI